MRHRRDHRKLNRATDQRLAERIITTAKRGDLHARRQVLRRIHDQDLVKHLFEEIAPRYADRDGGYTRVVRAGRRAGDNAEMAILELTD